MYRGTARAYGHEHHIFSAHYMGHVFPAVDDGFIGLKSTDEVTVFMHFSEWYIPNNGAEMKATEMTLISNALLDDVLIEEIEREYGLAGRRIHPRHYEQEEMLNALSVLLLYHSLGAEESAEQLVKAN
ncbi:hypothetical protein HYU15_03405 [Candidatus Woesearchaeota archaeon]|nr:hypothetical protein [Candidatus Woesearchaeota archaeon]